jgi:type IV pilus assembly protein PilZ
MTRQHPRAPIELKVAYKRMNAFFADYTRDISKGGIFIKSESPLPMGSEIEFEITLPKRPTPIELTGKVAWSEPSRGMGIQFTWKTDAERATFEQLAEEMMIEALGETIYRQLIEKGRE